MSTTPSIKPDPEAAMAPASLPPSSPGPTAMEEEGDKKRKKPATKAANGTVKKTSEEMLQRRREGRLKAAATIANNLKKTGIGRFEAENGFAFTSIKTIPLVNQKNYFAEYLKKDEQITLIRNWRNEKLNAPNSKSAGSEGAQKENEEEDDDEDDEETGTESTRTGYDTIVIHVGSENMRIGRATDREPVTVPMVIAVPDFPGSGHNLSLDASPTRQVDEDGAVSFGEDFEATKAVVTKDFKARMRFYKRRMMPNSRESAANFNKTQKPEVVPDNSDPDYREFFDPNDPILKERDFFAADDALKVPISSEFTSWRLRYPIVNGVFNQSSDYLSVQEFYSDLTKITNAALKAIDVSSEELPRLKCMFVIPDLYEKTYIETWASVLLNDVGFGKFGILQEAVAATFGSGVSCACVVDVGAERTTVSCVDEGLIVPDSRVNLNYGGAHITEAFVKLLLEQNFPVNDIDLQRKLDDWELADRLKRNFGTFDDSVIAVQLYNFYRRRAGGPTEKYNFKVYDEVMLAPLGLFYPDLFQLSNEEKPKALIPDTLDQYSGETSNPVSKAHTSLANNVSYTDMLEENLILRLVEDKQLYKQSVAAYGKPVDTTPHIVKEDGKVYHAPLDKAIIESITNAGIATDFNRAKKMYDNVLVVGGGLSKFPGFDVLLSDRINIWRPRILSSSELDDIIAYVNKEKELAEAKKKQLIAAAKAKRKQDVDLPDDPTIPEDVMKAIEDEAAFSLDTSRINTFLDESLVVPVNILLAPREIEPEILSWKGASVYSRLKVVNEMWIGKDDWDLLNTRCLFYKSLFNY